MGVQQLSLADEVRIQFKGYPFGSPCPEAEIRRAESELGEALPPVLAELYTGFDGFRGPTNAVFFFPVFDPANSGLVETNKFFRNDKTFPQDLVSKCIFYGSDGTGAYWGIKRDLPDCVIQSHCAASRQRIAGKNMAVTERRIDWHSQSAGANL
jgi:hypothetical protein